MAGSDGKAIVTPRTVQSAAAADEKPVVIRATARKGTPTARWGRKARGPSWSAQLPRSGSARSRAPFTGLTVFVRGGQEMLARLRKAMDEKEQGFTLIELLVVMIIIGILAAI